MALAPAASMYARTPQDMRLLRLLLAQKNSLPVTAYYIGIANGEDFYSWLNVALGTKCHLRWVGIDIREECVARVSAILGHYGIPHELHCRDYHNGIPDNMDVVIANRIWETDLLANQKGLRRILATQPHMLITRGHGLNDTQLRDRVLPEGYSLYTHANQCDDYRPEVPGFFFVKNGTWKIDVESPHTRITKIA